MSNRFVIEESGMRWDRIAVARMEHGDAISARSSVSITGLVAGKDGTLVLRLPGMLETHYTVDPGEARAMRDALVARVQDDGPKAFIVNAEPVEMEAPNGSADGS